jgi:hypothetical protein
MAQALSTLIQVASHMTPTEIQKGLSGPRCFAGRLHLYRKLTKPGRAEQRAKLAIEFYHVTSKLVIDALVGPDQSGRFRLEANEDVTQNPRGSTFQSLLHLFCNITSVPIDVYVFQKANPNLIAYSMFMYAPDTPAGGWDSITAVPIRF